MIRETTAPRKNWQERIGDEFFTKPEGKAMLPYWSEDACYKFTAEQVDQIEEAAQELHARCMDAVQHIIDKNLFHRFGIPEHMKDYIKKSWERRDPDIYGRFDLAYDGVNPPKMLEYNADTAGALYEASVLQAEWAQDRKLPGQFNSIHEKLTGAWKRIDEKYNVPKPFYFAAADNEEDVMTAEYVRGTAEAAGIKTQPINIGDIGWNGKHFTDMDENRIGGFWKLYPWEWMANEEFSKHLIRDNTAVLEPAWKMLLSNKEILPILWEMFPDHPNLLPAYETPEKLQGEGYVKKPKDGRQGDSIEIVTPAFSEAAKNSFGDTNYIYQKYVPLPDFKGHHPVIGAWIVGGEAAGMGILESEGSKITTSESRFVPHYFIP